MADDCDNDTDEEPFYEGTYGKVRFAQMSDGSKPASEFWDTMTGRERGKLSSLFAQATNSPQLQLRNRTKFKSVEGRPSLNEFKVNSEKMRMFCFRMGDSIYLVHGIRGKKEDKIDPGEVDRAERLMRDAKKVLQRTETTR